MSVECKICSTKVHEKGDKNLVLCEHHRGFVHRNCCVSECSMHGAPCSHAIYEYKKLNVERMSPEMFSSFDE